MIKFKNLKKIYKTNDGKSVKALDGFSLEINDNEVFALAGVNGAGKTTALKALFKLINTDEGEMELNEESSKDCLQIATASTKPHNDDFRIKMGFAPEIPDLPEYLNVKEVLELSCKIAGIKPTQELIDEAVSLFELFPIKDKLVSNLSKGNKQRLSLAAAVVYKPDIIVFDEPTSGLDPLGRKLIKSVIKELKQRGHTILFSTHFLADLPELCDKMAVVHEGKIVFAGKVSEFCSNSSLEALEDRFAKIVSTEQENV